MAQYLTPELASMQAGVSSMCGYDAPPCIARGASCRRFHRPGILKLHADDRQRLIESFHDVDAAPLVPVERVAVLAAVDIDDVQKCDEAHRAEAATIVRTQGQRVIGRHALTVRINDLFRIS